MFTLPGTTRYSIAMSSVTTQLEQASRQSSISLESRPQSPSTREFGQNASIVLIGSRGSGKRSLGFIGATRKMLYLFKSCFLPGKLNVKSSRRLAELHSVKFFEHFRQKLRTRIFAVRIIRMLWVDLMCDSAAADLL